MLEYNVMHYKEKAEYYSSIVSGTSKKFVNRFHISCFLTVVISV